MIVLAVGLMGAGKTYEIVNFHIIPALLNGRKVITNIPLNIDHICAVHGEHLRELIDVKEGVIDENGELDDIPFSVPNDLKNDWRNEKTNQGALFVIDEAQFPFAAGESEFNKWVVKYATMQRHRGHDWILMTQDSSLIYTRLVKLVTVTHFFEKCTNVGQSHRYRHIVYDGFSVSKDFRIKHETKTYEKKLFSFYKSHTDSEGSVEEANITGAFFNLKGLIIGLILLILFVVCMIVYFAYRINNRYSLDDNLVVDEVSIPVENIQKLSSNNAIERQSSVDNDQSSQSIVDIPKKINYINLDEENRNTIAEVMPEVTRVIVDKDVNISIHQVKKAPFNEGFKFHIIGSFLMKGKDSDFYYGVWSPDGVQEQIGRKELISLGYTVNVLSRCVHLLDHRYQSEPVYITCHAPVYEKEDTEGKKDPNKSKTRDVADQLANKSG